MAAPTSFRVHAIGQNTTFLKWVYPGTKGIGVYRSTDGVTYALINPSTVPVGTVSYIDTELTSGTKYWYKLSDDDEVTFSDVKTVKTHSCGDEGGGKKRKGFHLPRFGPLSKEIPIHRLKGGKDDNENDKEIPIHHMKLGKAMRDIEDVIKKNVFHQEPCEVCIVDGAIIIDCADGCDCYNVEANVDINSISFINCSGIDPCIHFRVPPGTTVGICGWPQGHDAFTSQAGGDECFEAPVSGGTEGKTITTGPGNPPSSKPGSGKGGRGGGGGCECVPGAAGQLTVKCCTRDCSMDCQTAKSQEVKICGGTGPYDVSGSAGLTFNGDATLTGINSSTTITIAPPTNAGSGVAGVAYARCFSGQTAAEPCACESCQCDHGCGDVATGGFATNSSGCTLPLPVIYLVTTPFPDCTHVGACIPADPQAMNASCSAAHCTGTAGGTITDKRTAPMIAAGCNPCAVASSSKTVTVTDAEGVSVVTTVTG